MIKPLPLDGKVAIVTGAARGIGVAVSEYLAEDGAHVVLAGRNETALRAGAAALDEKFPGRESLAVRCDVTDEDQVRAMTSTAAARFGGIDILVNTAGGTGPIERLGRSPADVCADFAAQTAMGRFVEESDVAGAVRFLVSPGARNTTGHDIPVDAGWDV